MRDLTRGGLASALNEVALAAGVNIELESATIPVEEQVQGACEILGLDPLYIANEGRFVAFVLASAASDVWTDLQKYHSRAQIIGRVVDDQRTLVTMKNAIGSQRILDFLSGEQLPRIC